MNTPNINIDCSDFYLTEEEIERRNNLKESIRFWEISRDIYFSELNNLKCVVISKETKMRKKQCKSGLRATNEWIGQALEEIDELETKARKEEEKWLRLEEIELSFK